MALDHRHTDSNVWQPAHSSPALDFAGELQELAELGLIELTPDDAGELRCEVTELGAAVEVATPIKDDHEEAP